MTCPGHGINLGPYMGRPVPPGHCVYCELPYGTFTPPPPPHPAAKGLPPGTSGGGVMRNETGHIVGVIYSELTPENAWLAEWKDKPLGPGHPLASHIDPRCFIPGVASAPSPGPPGVMRPVTDVQHGPRATGQGLMPPPSPPAGGVGAPVAPADDTAAVGGGAGAANSSAAAQ
jgi:hypothetical protein